MKRERGGRGRGYRETFATDEFGASFQPQKKKKKKLHSKEKYVYN